MPAHAVSLVELGLLVAFFPLFGVATLGSVARLSAGVGRGFLPLLLYAPAFLLLSAIVVRGLYAAAGSPELPDVTLYHAVILIIAWTMMTVASAMILRRIHGDVQHAPEPRSEPAPADGIHHQPVQP